MGKIIISGLTVHAVIGVYAFEQSITQTLSIDLSFAVDVNHAAENDLLNDTHDYAVICHSITSFIEKTPCRLLETLAKRLIDYLKNELQLTQVQLSITKHPKDLPNVSGITVSISA
ncbi:MAG: dihydroneopterin aldolase [Gammaproteobacteria bacterium RIFCSPHIGHO2_12_FULL_38_11]|nr:MAG: dihydroneopterin aldolase [Gammaproteobacteria bacterium RIFCSPHIGHO2_12_FULL_38_11]